MPIATPYICRYSESQIKEFGNPESEEERHALAFHAPVGSPALTKPALTNPASTSDWSSKRSTNAIERMNQEFHHRIRTRTVQAQSETVPMLLWAQMASSRIRAPGLDGWKTLVQPFEPTTLYLVA